MDTSLARPIPAPSALLQRTPKLVTTLRERYHLRDLRADATAGLTVAIVALPLSMAIAVASGVSPDRGLYAAIVGGFIVAALGGSRFQVGGPAGAFIVLVAGIGAAHGLSGLLLATFLSGVILVVIGALGLGALVRYIPHPVTVGFTAGIAVIIAASQVKELLGLRLAAPEPGPIVAKVPALLAAMPSINPSAAAIAALCVLVIVLVRHYRPTWPALLIAVALAALLTEALRLPVDTIASRFGGIPSGLPSPRLPDFEPGRILEVLPAAGSLALLGAIESLLSAVVADSMTGRRHRPNAELVAQGLANMASPLFGGISVTGTIARTATNVRAGARSPLASMMHSVFLMLFLLLAAPLAGRIPLAALSGVLLVVAWSMAERHEFATLLRASWGDALVLLATFLLVVFRDLSLGILVGVALGGLLFMHRMAHAVHVEPEHDTPTQPADGPGRVVYRISGAVFFGAAARVAMALDWAGPQPGAFVLDLAEVPVVDSTAAATLRIFARQANRRGVPVFVVGARRSVRRVLLTHGVRPPAVRFRASAAPSTATPDAALPV